MEKIEYLLGLPDIKDYIGYTIVQDSSNNMFYLISLDNGIALNSAHFTTSGTITSTGDSSYDNIGFSTSTVFFLATIILVIIAIYLLKSYTFKKSLNKWIG